MGKIIWALLSFVSLNSYGIDTEEYRKLIWGLTPWVWAFTYTFDKCKDVFDCTLPTDESVKALVDGYNGKRAQRQQIMTVQKEMADKVVLEHQAIYDKKIALLDAFPRTKQFVLDWRNAFPNGISMHIQRSKVTLLS